MASVKKNGVDLTAVVGVIFVILLFTVILGGWSLLMAYATRYVLAIFHFKVTLWQSFVVWFVLSSLFGMAKNASSKKGE